MDITHDKQKGSLFLSQEGYINMVLNKFGMNDSKPFNTPLAQHFKLRAIQPPKEAVEIVTMKNIPYSNVMGSIMYVMVYNKPDLAYSSSMISRIMDKPRNEHWQAIKWVLRDL